MWRSVGQDAFTFSNQIERVSVSIGVAVYPSRDIKSKDQLIKAADRALYQAKHSGRNRVVKRTAHLTAHAGQISFPGGRIEAHDPDPENAALRETE